jgi:hypothetical protein
MQTLQTKEAKQSTIPYESTTQSNHLTPKVVESEISNGEVNLNVPENK